MTITYKHTIRTIIRLSDEKHMNLQTMLNNRYKLLYTFVVKAKGFWVARRIVEDSLLELFVFVLVDVDVMVWTWDLELWAWEFREKE